MKSTRSSVQEILDSLQDEEFVNYFANVHGIVGDPDVDHRLDEIRGVNYNYLLRKIRVLFKLGKGWMMNEMRTSLKLIMSGRSR